MLIRRTIKGNQLSKRVKQIDESVYVGLCVTKYCY